MNTIIFSAILGVLMMFGGIAIKNAAAFKNIAVVALLLLLGANISETYGWFSINVNTRGMLEFSKFGMYFNSLAIFSTLAFIFLSGRDIEYVHNGKNVADYYALLFFIIAGIGIVSSFNNLLMLFLGIEIISIPLYILTGSDKKNLKSNEAALKYFLMGAFSTGIMLMGIALLYGALGSFSIDVYKPVVPGFTLAQARLTQLGMVLLFISMAFKVSAAPFHFWTPDVYDGAPSVFTSFMSTIVKAAVFIGFIKLFEQKAYLMGDMWHLLVSIIVIATLFIGNITAVFQQSVKRMLAYSSIAQAGFMLFALYSLNSVAKEGLLLYAIAYSLATVGIFAVLIKMKDYTFEGYNGLAKTQPVLAATTAIFLLSLAGVPVTAGFFAKFYMLRSVVESGHGIYMVIIAIIFAAVSVYYYFKLIQSMYFKEGNAETAPVSSTFKAGLIVLAALIIVIGIKPDLILDWFYF